MEKLVMDEEEKLTLRKKHSKEQTKEESIRREYRRFIKKNRKDCPAPYETPTEIEILAGVAETEMGKKLHESYEQVRYGKLP